MHYTCVQVTSNEKDLYMIDLMWCNDWMTWNTFCKWFSIDLTQIRISSQILSCSLFMCIFQVLLTYLSEFF